MLDVIGFGSLNYDRLYRVQNFPNPGEQTPIIETYEDMGGSSANTIVGLSRLGFKTAHMSSLGTDHEGKTILDIFEKEKISKDFLSMKQGRTSSVVAIVDSKGERTMYINPGVSALLSISDVDFESIALAKFLHLSPFVGEKQFALQKTVVNKIDTLKTKISFAPGHRYSEKGISALESILRKTYILFLNEPELQLLAGLEKNTDYEINYKEACGKLLKLGIKIVAVTLSERGAFVCSENFAEIIPAFKTNVLDTTGAGDAFAAGFLAGILSEKDIKKCTQLGNKIASFCIQKMGARAGLPTMNGQRI